VKVDRVFKAINNTRFKWLMSCSGIEKMGTEHTSYSYTVKMDDRNYSKHNKGNYRMSSEVVDSTCEAHKYATKVADSTTNNDGDVESNTSWNIMTMLARNEFSRATPLDDEICGDTRAIESIMQSTTIQSVQGCNYSENDCNKRTAALVERIQMESNSAHSTMWSSNAYWSSCRDLIRIVPVKDQHKIDYTMTLTSQTIEELDYTQQTAKPGGNKVKEQIHSYTGGSKIMITHDQQDCVRENLRFTDEKGSGVNKSSMTTPCLGLEILWVDNMGDMYKVVVSNATPVVVTGIKACTTTMLDCGQQDYNCNGITLQFAIKAHNAKRIASGVIAGSKGCDSITEISDDRESNSYPTMMLTCFECSNMRLRRMTSSIGCDSIVVMTDGDKSYDCIANLNSFMPSYDYAKTNHKDIKTMVSVGMRVKMTANRSNDLMASSTDCSSIKMVAGGHTPCRYTKAVQACNEVSCTMTVLTIEFYREINNTDGVMAGSDDCDSITVMTGDQESYSHITTTCISMPKCKNCRSTVLLGKEALEASNSNNQVIVNNGPYNGYCGNITKIGNEFHIMKVELSKHKCSVPTAEQHDGVNFDGYAKYKRFQCWSQATKAEGTAGVGERSEDNSEKETSDMTIKAAEIAGNDCKLLHKSEQRHSDRQLITDDVMVMGSMHTNQQWKADHSEELQQQMKQQMRLSMMIILLTILLTPTSVQQCHENSEECNRSGGLVDTNFECFINMTDSVTELNGQSQTNIDSHRKDLVTMTSEEFVEWFISYLDRTLWDRPNVCKRRSCYPQIMRTLQKASMMAVMWKPQI